jgi:hypothetical protein
VLTKLSGYDLLLVIRSLPDVHELNMYMEDNVVLSVRMFHLENSWTDFDEI